MEMIKCQQCGKEVPAREAVDEKIFYHGREERYDSRRRAYVSKAVLKTKVMSFCSNVCASHCQMAHEG